MEDIIAVYGLGYVGLPTALHFASKGYKVIGVDVNKSIIESLNKGKVHLKDLDLQYLLEEHKNNFEATTDGIDASKKANIHIICVPTPIKETKIPDLSYVFSAAETIAKGLKKGDIVVLESTVYPTFSEEELIPFLEQKSGLKINEDFFVAHVPERYNPGDKNHTIDKVIRVVGASSSEAAAKVADLYKKIVKDTHIVRDLRTAEAAKIIENIQRDLNIALMNELAMIADKLKIDIKEVIDAAATKWNFIKFVPGIGVGGHCLPVDPYYLTYLAHKKDHHPKVILSGRAINDNMPFYSFNLIIKALNNLEKSVKGSKIAILGLSYKGNIGDFRNSPSTKLIELLKNFGAEVKVHDPYHLDYNNTKIENIVEDVDVIVIATDHDYYKNLNLEELKKYTKKEKVIFFDGRLIFDPDKVKEAGFIYIGVGREKYKER
ncbi:MAG: nucleotide sugar dehydrogenase [Candidatus Nanohaloarchaeota archaeon]|nr:nucleotide sugar dehydrogenase [Candidatus Nanohaloarchaeota archaeon]